MCFWEGRQGRANAETCVEYAFTEILGLNMSRSPFSIDERLFRANQREYLESVVTAEDKNWKNLFAQLRLAGMMVNSQYFTSTYSAVKSTFPWAFNLATQEGEHLHQWDFFQRDIWQGSRGLSLARFALKHVMEKHYGLQMDKESGSIDERLFPRVVLGRTHISPSAFGFNYWDRLFAESGLGGMIGSVPGLDGKTSKAFQLSYPWAFDLATEEGRHLHYWDFNSEGTWKGDRGSRLAVAAISHIFEKHLGLEMTPPEEDRESNIDKRLLSGDVDKFLRDNGFESWLKLCQAHLRIVDTMRKDVPGIGTGIRGILEFVYPWAFDLDSPEGRHLHFWTISLKFDSWEKTNDIIDAITHEVDREGWEISELPDLATEDWIVSVGLGGLLGTRFKHSRYEMIKFVYPETFQSGALGEADFKWLKTTDEKQPMRLIRAADYDAARVGIQGTNYILPTEYLDKYARKINDKEIGIFEKVEADDHVEFVLVAKFCIPTEETDRYKVAEIFSQ